MAHLEYFLVAESCSRDMSRNSISIFHVLNDVRLFEFPSEIGELCVVCGWIMEASEIKEQEEFQILIRFEMSGGKDIEEIRANLTATTRFENVYFRCADVPVSSPGDMKIHLLLNGEEQASHTIAVALFDDDAKS